MDTSNVKKYAPQARKDFIAEVSKQAAKYGVTKEAILAAEKKGDVLVIGDALFPVSVLKPREKLIERIQTSGYEQTIEYIAYSWFNRLCALRYMECKGLLDHGRRVLSGADGSAGLPQILEECLDIELPGLDRNHVIELKLDGNKDEELYRTLLLAQCHALHQVMPLLFTKVSDEVELLLPDNLTKTDSLIRDLVNAIPEEDWSDVEIIGWLYQFYISDKKEQVIGKVVKSEDIPAATQLFTPNWIVKYLVQNSIGRLWLMAHPESHLASDWEYYITPAEQSDEVNAELQALINVRIREDGDSLNPESITVLDPACGSGHILVEAYECLKSIYLERGYRSRDIPRLILEKNLYGIDIDSRAAQLASFALLMKAREDDRRLFSTPLKLNIIALQDSQPRYQETVDEHFTGFDIDRIALKDLISLFEYASTYGSLVQIPEELIAKLTQLESSLNEVVQSGDMFAVQLAQDLLPLIEQAKILSKQYDAVIANPPYMGSKGMNAALKEFTRKRFSDSKSDMFAMFIERGFDWCKITGFNSMVTMQSWMFLSSYEKMREKILENKTLSCMLHMGNGVMGIAFGTAATVVMNTHIKNYEAGFSYCENTDLDTSGVPQQFPIQNERLKTTKIDDFKKIPGSPIAYWVSDDIKECFAKLIAVNYNAAAVCGMTTGENALYVRDWTEINFQKFGKNFNCSEKAKQSGLKWFPYAKGGSFRKWYGNAECVVDWECDGRNIVSSGRAFPRARVRYFKPSVSWSFISSSYFGARQQPAGFIFDMAGCSLFPNNEEDLPFYTALLCSKTTSSFLRVINPTLNYQVNNVGNVPVPESVNRKDIAKLSSKCVSISKHDWDSYETSWDFTENPIVRTQQPNLEQSFNTWQQQNTAAVAEMKQLEEENNKLFIDAYGLEDELTPDVPDEQITLTRADREKDSQRLVSYAIGCMMGRYSLDESGLIYAHAGNEGFEHSRYKKFPADVDGIIPLTEEHWLDDDVATRIKEFLGVVWGGESLDSNMQWLADSLGKKAAETPEESIRRYLATKFYKDHMQTYQKRPIYWLFSSGKLGAFQALVYLHRYNESTLARMRTEYVMPLMSKMAAYVKSLETSKENSDSAAETKRIEKKIQDLEKQQAELSIFEEKLRHYADQRISLDLDDGVRVNYGKFGDLLANVKDIAAKGKD